jgi:hypothetical protein
MKQILYILIGLISYIECKSCDCSYEQRAISITNAILNDDLIFCGELVPGNFVNPFVTAYQFKVQSLANKVEGQFYWLAELEQLRHYKRTQSAVIKYFDLKSILIYCLILMNIALITVTIINGRR